MSKPVRSLGGTVVQRFRLRMTLRDYFAGQALAGNCGYNVQGRDGVTSEELAEEAYNIADAMLEERAKP